MQKHRHRLSADLSWVFKLSTNCLYSSFLDIFQISTDYTFPSSTEKRLIFTMKPPSSVPHNLVSCFWFVDFGAPAVLAATAIMSPS